MCWMFSVEGLRVLVICARRWCKVSLHLPSSRSAVFTDLWELRTSEYYAFHKVMNVAQFLKKLNYKDFPGGPVVKTAHFHCRGSLVRDLRSCMLCGTGQRKRIVDLQYYIMIVAQFAFQGDVAEC